MNQISDYSSDDGTLSPSDFFKQDFDLVSPEELNYYSESLLHDFEELNRAFIFGLAVPRTIIDLRKWIEENLHPQLQLHENIPTFFHDILILRKVKTNL